MPAEILAGMDFAFCSWSRLPSLIFMSMPPHLQRLQVVILVEGHAEED